MSWTHALIAVALLALAGCASDSAPREPQTREQYLEWRTKVLLRSESQFISFAELSAASPEELAGRTVRFRALWRGIGEDTAVEVHPTTKRTQKVVLLSDPEGGAGEVRLILDGDDLGDERTTYDALATPEGTPVNVCAYMHRLDDSERYPWIGHLLTQQRRDSPR